MSKYEPLRRYLEKARTTEVPMTFAQIEGVLGFALPNSRNIRAWWSNNPDNNVMTEEWLAAGYRTERVDIAGQRLVFRRTRGSAMTDKQAAEAHKRKGEHPIVGALKDVTWIAPGIDLTEPADPQWADLIEDPNWGKLPE
jgi:hypothetical protein